MQHVATWVCAVAVAAQPPEWEAAPDRCPPPEPRVSRCRTPAPPLSPAPVRPASPTPVRSASPAIALSSSLIPVGPGPRKHSEPRCPSGVRWRSLRIHPPNRWASPPPTPAAEVRSTTRIRFLGAWLFPSSGRAESSRVLMGPGWVAWQVSAPAGPLGYASRGRRRRWCRRAGRPPSARWRGRVRYRRPRCGLPW